MLKAVKTDLEDICDALEHLLAQIDRLSLAEKIDLAARLRGASKTCKTIDELVKEMITQKLRGKMGVVPGEVWKASLNVFPVTRLNQLKLKVELPKVHTKYCETADEQRILFEAR